MYRVFPPHPYCVDVCGRYEWLCPKSMTWSGRYQRAWLIWWHRWGRWGALHHSADRWFPSLPRLSPSFLQRKASLGVSRWRGNPFVQIYEQNVEKRHPVLPSQPLARHAVSSPPSFSTSPGESDRATDVCSPADPQNTNSFLSVRFLCTCTKPLELTIHFSQHIVSTCLWMHDYPLSIKEGLYLRNSLDCNKHVLH